MPQTEKSINDYLLILYRRRLFLTLFTGMVTVASIVVSLLLTEWYVSEAVVLPPTEEFSIFPSSSLSRMSIPNLALGGKTEITDRYLAILNSRSILDSVVNEFDLINLYAAENIEDARNILRDNLEFEVDEEGTLRVIAWDTSPDRASEMANYLVARLDETNKALTTQEARFKRITIQNRYEQNVRDLTRVEEDFKAFQKKNGVVALPEQTEATIKAAAELMGQLSLLELELGVKEKSLSSMHPDIQKIEARIAEYKKQINNIMYSDRPFIEGSKTDNENVFISYSQFPELSIQYIRLKRNLEAQQTLFALLNEQLELARLMETKDTPSLQILDKAVPPIKRAWPKRSVIVILTAISSFIISALYLVVKQYLHDLGANLHQMTVYQE